MEGGIGGGILEFHDLLILQVLRAWAAGLRFTEMPGVRLESQ